MLMNDTRECATEVNKYLEEQRRIASFKVEGAVEVYNDSYLFGHYDSRGGATLIVGARSGLQACISYNRSAGWPDLSNAPLEDILTPTGCEVHFVGRKPERLQELDYGFADAASGYLYARVWTRWNNKGHPATWEPAPAWVFFPVPTDWEKDGENSELADLWAACQDGDYKGLTKLKSIMPKVEFVNKPILDTQIQLRPDSLGEDAFGVILCQFDPQDVTDVNPDPDF